MNVTRAFHEFTVEINVVKELCHSFSEMVFSWGGAPVTVEVQVSRKIPRWHAIGTYEGGFGHVILGPVWAVRFTQEHKTRATQRAVQISAVTR